MNSEKKLIDNKILIVLVILIPLIIISLVIIGRHIITPTNEEIIEDLKNTKFYTCEVKYEFKNSKADFEENTKQYYSYDKGMRIEFEEGLERVKVYKGSEIKVQGSNDENFTLDKDIDIIYPLAFLENIFSNTMYGDIEVIKPEWCDTEYLKVNFKYDYKNKHLDRAELYVDKNTKSPALLKIYDDEDKDRITVTYTNFKQEKQLDDDLF